jgi:acetyl esterase/lipase
MEFNAQWLLSYLKNYNLKIMSILPTPSALPSDVSDLPATFYENVKYQGYSENVFDYFKPIGGAAVKPIAILFFGGGFVSGDKSNWYDFLEQRTVLTALINADIAVACPNYRLISTDNTEILGIKKCMKDGINAVQRILFNSVELGIDPTNFALHGDSAGGSICMFLAGQSFALPSASNYKIQGTRPIAIASYRPQTLDIPRWDRFFPSLTFQEILDSSNEARVRCYNFFGLTAPAVAVAADFDAKDTYNYARRMGMVNHSKPVGIELHLENFDSFDDPTNFGALIHHPKYAQAYKDKWDAAGESCTFYTTDPPAESSVEFLIRLLNA